MAQTCRYDVFPLDMARHHRSILEARFDRSPTSAFAGDLIIPSDDLVQSLHMCGSYIKAKKCLCGRKSMYWKVFTYAALY